MSKISKIADDLRGTCSANIDLDDYTEEELSELDELVFCCTECNWWSDKEECEESDLGEWICQQCHSESQEKSED